MEDIGADEYKIEENSRNYVLKIGSTNNKINLNLSTNDYGQSKNYAGEFTLNDLRQINRVFLLTPTIYEAKEEFKKAVERKKIGISEKDDYVHTIFYMMIGTDTSTLSIALPRDETPRIIKLEQKSNMLKLGRDNLRDRLIYLDREADEIKRDQDEIQNENVTLQSIADTIGQGIPNITLPQAQPQYEPGQPYIGMNANKEYSSAEIERNAPQQYTSIQTRPNKEYSSAEIERNAPQQYTSIRTRPNREYSSSEIERNAPQQYSPAQPQPTREYSSSEIERNAPQQYVPPPSTSNEFANPEPDKIAPESTGHAFRSGILNNIIKNESEIEFVLNKIEEKFPGAGYKIIFKGTSDGDSSDAFHSKCDSAQKTLVIVEDTYGNRFGGFTTQNWSGQYVQKKDNDAFIFSIDKEQTYDVIPDQNAIGCYPNFGPVFYGCQIRIYDKFFSKGGTTYKKGLNYYTNEDYELTGGNQNFSVRDMEVYEVSY